MQISHVQNICSIIHSKHERKYIFEYCDIETMHVHVMFNFRPEKPSKSRRFSMFVRRVFNSFEIQIYFN